MSMPLFTSLSMPKYIPMPIVNTETLQEEEEEQQEQDITAPQPMINGVKSSLKPTVSKQGNTSLEFAGELVQQLAASHHTAPHHFTSHLKKRHLLITFHPTTCHHTTSHYTTPPATPCHIA